MASVTDRADAVTTEEDLREIVPPPHRIVLEKQLDHLDQHARRFIETSPMLVLATADRAGRVDASPRGDPAGFVKVLDQSRLLIPDRKGNRRVDSMANILENPQIGTLFLIPGREDTLRVNGRASLTDDPGLLAQCEVKGSVPLLGIILEVEEVFFHCARAFHRSGLWDPSRWPDSNDLASLGKALKEQTGDDSHSAKSWDEMLEEANRDLY